MTEGKREIAEALREGLTKRLPRVAEQVDLEAVANELADDLEEWYVQWVNDTKSRFDTALVAVMDYDRSVKDRLQERIDKLKMEKTKLSLQVSRLVALQPDEVEATEA